MGGLYFGVFTDIESAAVGAIGAFFFAVWRGRLNRGAFFDVMVETTTTTALVYGLIIGAQIFSFFVSVSALTESITGFIASLHWSNLALMGLILLGYLLLGTVMEFVCRHDHHGSDHHAACGQHGLRHYLVGHRHAVRGRDRADPSAVRAQCHRLERNKSADVRSGPSTRASHRSLWPT